MGLQRRIEEAEGQQHPRPGQAGCGLGRGQSCPAGPGRAGEALGQLKAARTAQFQAVGPAAGGDAQTRGPIPEEAEAVAAAIEPLQVGEQQQRVAGPQGNGQAQQAVFVELPGAAARLGQQLCEAAFPCLHLFGPGGCHDARLD
jgi:hypothetical protein